MRPKRLPGLALLKGGAALLLGFWGSIRGGLRRRCQKLVCACPGRHSNPERKYNHRANCHPQFGNSRIRYLADPSKSRFSRGSRKISRPA
jgi:hypothetical protein